MIDPKQRWEILLNPVRFRDKKRPSIFDRRNDFENDYSRLISSSPIRRLQDKTQVFPLEKSDFIRTRLTHSLEVSSIARSIGKSIEKILEGKDLLINDSGISSLLANAGLIHDLGNPPYGHFGETAIQNYFTNLFESQGKYPSLKKWTKQMKMDFKKYDGNVQTLRILTRLQYLGKEHGFNLSFPTLASIIKYPRRSDVGNKDTKNISDKKFGFFLTEGNLFEEINSILELKGERHPVTFLLEAADDIAYSGADIEDGVKLGILKYDIIVKEFDSKRGKLNSKQRKAVSEFKKEYKRLQGIEGTDALDIAVQNFRIISQGIMIDSILNEFIDNHTSILNGTYKKELLKGSSSGDFKECFKNLSYVVYKNKTIVEKELSGYVVIQGLLDEYIQAALKGKFHKNEKGKCGRLYNLVSSSYRFIYEQELKKNIGKPKSKRIDPLYLQFQLITDFIGGMTDTYALELYQRISGIR